MCPLLHLYASKYYPKFLVSGSVKQCFTKGAEHHGHTLYVSAVYCTYCRIYHVKHCWIPIRKSYNFRLGVKLNSSCNFSCFIASFLFPPLNSAIFKILVGGMEKALNTCYSLL